MPTTSELFELALRCHQGGNIAQAEALYRQILQADGAHAGAHFFLGAIAHQHGYHDDALMLMRYALTLNPNEPVYLYNLGNILAELGRREDAVAAYQAALQLNPGYARAHNNLGYVLMALERRVEALACFEAALALNSYLADAHFNMGLVLTDLGRQGEAANAMCQALACTPRDGGIYLTLGNLLAAQGKADEAAKQYAASACLDPQTTKSVWNRALLRLARGDFEQGWAEYESRWSVPGIVRRHHDRPRWDGSPAEGKTVLVYAEQGLGDTLQFIRYAPLIQERGARVIFQCQPAILSLLATAPGINQLSPLDAEPPSFDLQTPLLSLPRIFGTTLATIPKTTPYLTADSTRIGRWRHRLAALPGFKIGVCWHGDPSNKNNVLRSAPLAHFDALTHIPGVSIISLQKGAGAEQLAPQVAKLPILDLGPDVDADAAFTDTAAIMMNLDLVITIDSALAHLAGALAVPVWTLVAFRPDWRWLLDRLDSPWYPTMRLFRQERPCAWEEVFAKVAVELKSKTATVEPR